MNWAWHFDEITPLLLIIYELPHSPLSCSIIILPSQQEWGGGGIVPLNYSLGFIEYNLWANLYKPTILQLIQNDEQ